MEQNLDSINTRIQTFSDKLREIRNSKGISAREMSLSLGQNVNYINLIENGKRKPSLDMFFYICDYMNVAPEYFFNSNENESLPPYSKVLASLSDEQKTLLAEFVKSLLK